MRNSVELKTEVLGACICGKKGLALSFFFQIHFNQQELATNIITSILIPFGNLYSAEK